MSAKGKIAFLCHPYHRGGVTRWMADAAIAYARRGHEVYFVTVAPQQVFYSGEGRETMLQLLARDKHNVHVHSLPVGREFEFGSPAYCTYIYKQLLVKFVPLGTPIILSDDSYVWSAAASLHEAYPVVGVLHADEQYYYDVTARFKDSVDVFACVSDRVHKKAINQCPTLNPERVFTIPCGIELPAVAFKNTVSDKIRLVYVGRISDYQKRSGDLLKLAAALETKGIPFHLTIIGDGITARPELEQKFKAANLQHNVTFTGWLSQAQVHEHLTNSDTLVLTSDFEGMPIAMMEALAAGCGFVGTRVSGIEDYEFHPLAPACFRVFDVGDINDAVSKIVELSDVSLTARQKAARSLAESQFSMDICLDNYLHAMSVIKRTDFKPVQASLPATEHLKSRLISAARSLKMALKSK